MRITMIGSGYVGLFSGACLSDFDRGQVELSYDAVGR
jgi:UDP-glucose 6-dehydrogenase